MLRIFALIALLACNSIAWGVGFIVASLVASALKAAYQAGAENG